jgi:hypothetical protein
VARADSALFQKKDLLAQYSSALKARQVTLTAERNKAEQAKQEQLERAMPEAPQVAGLEFEKFGANSMHLNLPPPAERRPNSGLLGYNPNSDEP